MDHPSKDILCSISKDLHKKKIVLAVTGSVAAVKAPDLARSLMRHGAEVHCVLSLSAQKLIGKDLLEWATGNKVITELTGEVEHVRFMGNVEDKADLLLIAPCTANTISKIACGIDDTTVTTFATTAIGEGIPVIILPAMHKPMYDHPFVTENIQKLKNAGIKIIDPVLEEGKAKIADNNIILSECKRILSSSTLRNKTVYITAGRTVEYIDPIRVLTNNSTGKMGKSIAMSAYEKGADVTVFYAKGSVDFPSFIKVVNCSTTDDMLNNIKEHIKLKKPDIYISAAAPGDWKAENISEDKISTHENNKITLSLIPTPKILDQIRKLSKETYIVAFRALHSKTRKELIDNAYDRLIKADADLIAVNDVSLDNRGFESNFNELVLVNKDKSDYNLDLNSKDYIASELLNYISENI